METGKGVLTAPVLSVSVSHLAGMIATQDHSHQPCQGKTRPDSRAVLAPLRHWPIVKEWPGPSMRMAFKGNLLRARSWHIRSFSRISSHSCDLKLISTFTIQLSISQRLKESLPDTVTLQ